MKVILEIDLDGGMTLPVESEIATLGDLRKFGQKLALLPAGANKLIPGTSGREVKKLRFAKE